MREVRLRALADAPSAFVTTCTDPVARPDSSWQQRTAEAAIGKTHVLYLVNGAERFHGLAGGLLSGDPPHAHLFSVWVEPERRGTGAGEGLVRAVARWTAQRGLSELFLMVAADNQPAIRLYRHLGFTFTGQEQPNSGRERLEIVASLPALVDHSGPGS